MNMLQFLFGRAVRARRPHAGESSPPIGSVPRRTSGNPVAKRNATMQGLTPLQYVPALVDAAGAAPEFVNVAPPDFVTVPVLGDANGVVTAGEGQYGMDMWVEVGERFTGTFRVRLVQE